MAKGVTTAKINIRSGPGTSYDILYTIPKGQSFDSLDSQLVGSTTWYKINYKEEYVPSITGWISGDYCKMDDGSNNGSTDSGGSSSSGTSSSTADSSEFSITKKVIQVNPITGTENGGLVFFDENLSDYAGSVKKGRHLELVNQDKSGKWYLVRIPEGFEKAGTKRTELYIAQQDCALVESDDNLSEVNKYVKLSDQHISYFDNYKLTASSTLENDPYWGEMVDKINHAFGCPPKYNQDVDVQYNIDVDREGNATSLGIGRIMRKTFYSNPTILSICPGEVALFPSLFGIKKDSMMDLLIDTARGDTGVARSLISKMEGDTSALNSGQMYRFKTATANFARRVNVLCRAIAGLLGIGDKPMPGTSTKLINFDYAYWSIRKEYNPGAGDEQDHGIFKDFWNAIKDSAEGAVTDQNYIHFVVSNSASNVSETIATEVGPNSVLASLKDTVNNATASISYFLNTGFNETQDLSSALSSAMDGVIGQNWTKLANNLMEGAQMVFPDQITGVNFSQTASFQVSFVSPYGDPMAVFLWCIVPVMHLLALALPKQVGDNMYTFPFICKVNQKGWFNTDIAAITNVQIQRGGTDDTSWTSNGLSTEWVVSFEVAPLINSLMMPSSENPILFMKNDGLLNYLGNLCGFDLKANNFEEKKQLLLQFSKNKFTDFWSLNNMNRHISDWMDNKIGRFFRFEN